MKKNPTYLPLLLLFIGCSFLHSRSFGQRSPGDSLLNFINSNKSRSALYLIRNDDPLAALNQNKPMQLAQISNILIAIEFAQQATNGAFDENSYVPVKNVESYYIPAIDSSAQTSWLQDENDLQNIRNDSISLIEIARGMAIYNSSANAEYLMEMLGLDNVSNNIKLFNLKHQTFIYPIPASVFIYQNPKNEKQEDILKKVKDLSDKQFSDAIIFNHESLRDDTTFKATFKGKDFNLKMQKLWSDRLPSCTASDYLNVCTALNNRKNFTPITYQILSEIIESYMENPAMQKEFKHVGMISGSTPFIYNKILYGTTPDNKKVVMAYFFNNLTPDESSDIARWADDFDYKMLSNNKFRLKVAYVLSPP
jgi:D-alanyl-D-alanine carboxypeptidase